MPCIIYRQPGGAERVIEVAVGLNVMLGAIQNNVDGIDAECGGCLSCATCHVYVEPDYVTRLPPPEPDEAEMLDVTATPRRPTSRLSCQITVTQDLDGLIVQIPERQS